MIQELYWFYNYFTSCGPLYSGQLLKQYTELLLFAVDDIVKLAQSGAKDEDEFAPADFNPLLMTLANFIDHSTAEVSSDAAAQESLAILGQAVFTLVTHQPLFKSLLSIALGSEAQRRIGLAKHSLYTLSNLLALSHQLSDPNITAAVCQTLSENRAVKQLLQLHQPRISEDLAKVYAFDY